MREKMCELLKSGLIAGTASAAISFLLNYYLLPFPVTTLDNAIGHGVGGFFCGFISAFVGVLIFMLQHRMNKLKTVS